MIMRSSVHRPRRRFFRCSPAARRYARNPTIPPMSDVLLSAFGKDRSVRKVIEMKRTIVFVGLGLCVVLAASWSMYSPTPPDNAFVTGAGSRLHFAFGGHVNLVGQ